MTSEDRVILSRFTMELVTALAVLVAGVVVIVGAIEYDIGWDEAGPQAGYFPFYVGLIIVGASLGILAQTLLARRGAAEGFLSRVQAQRVAAFFLPIVAFVVLSVLLGLYVATLVYLGAVMVWQGGYRLPFALGVSAGVTVFFFVLFEWWFKVPLLKGPLEPLLGIH